MADFKISRAALLKQTVSQLNKLAGPGYMATFKFSLLKGILLLASSHEGNILGALQINRESLNHFICNSECYYVGVDLHQLCTVLNLAGDEDSVHITSCDASFQFIFQIQNSEEHNPIRLALNYKGAELIKEFDQMPHEDQYPMKVAISAPTFKISLNSLDQNDPDDKKIAFIDGYNRCQLVIDNGRNGVSIESARGNDCGPYHTRFNLKSLLSLDDSICMTDSVWIYPYCPRRGDDKVRPPALKCPIDPIGHIIYYYLSYIN